MVFGLVFIENEILVFQLFEIKSNYAFCSNSVSVADIFLL